MAKFLDDVEYDVEHAIDSEIKRAVDSMDALLEKHNCKDDWVNLPEIELRKYHQLSLLAGVLMTLRKRIQKIFALNIEDEEARYRELDTLTLIDMGR